MTIKNEKNTAQTLEIEELSSDASEAELAEAVGGIVTGISRDRVISAIKNFAFGDITLKVDRVRQGVAMLQSGHTPTPDIEAIRGAVSITRNRL